MRHYFVFFLIFLVACQAPAFSNHPQRIDLASCEEDSCIIGYAIAEHSRRPCSDIKDYNMQQECEKSCGIENSSCCIETFKCNPGLQCEEDICVTCGHEGQKACKRSERYDCAVGLDKSDDNFCLYCGGLGMDCCENKECEEWRTCSNLRCIVCGDIGEYCCSDDVCKEGTCLDGYCQ